VLVEWELTLECNYRCEYCTNGRNDCLSKPIKTELNELKILNFIEKNHFKYPEIEWFLFGGEPFLHPKLEFILEALIFLKQPYMIQTNFSRPNFELIERFKPILQVSIHQSQIKNLPETFRSLLKYTKYIRRIDIMYTSKEEEKLWDSWHKYFDRKIFLTPICDFRLPKTSTKMDSTNKVDELDYVESLQKFINLKNSKPQKCEPSNRCFVWMDMLTGKFTTKSKPCIYKNDYVLFAPNLKKYTCSHRGNYKICPNEHCFLMDFEKFETLKI
jgi:organic radical activating enzyme